MRSLVITWHMAAWSGDQYGPYKEVQLAAGYSHTRQQVRVRAGACSGYSPCCSAELASVAGSGNGHSWGGNSQDCYGGFSWWCVGQARLGIIAACWVLSLTPSPVVQVTARSAFTHQIKHQRRPDHQLITHGIFRWGGQSDVTSSKHVTAPTQSACASQTTDMFP